ncbi:hypothetical protein JYK14_04495 [Siccirubricoccus sp. KC 17139]|uniref:Uncharacterized protein n=1 Tax=Siccirubricoccus soli TaxID=2899147 RepID=A0ABT1D0N0_9PROT|nr:hypothetical protein [Siccirubricoccus soli]MCO6415437.1 hypothetical protein [Siccirubricoccus soli]MCP2681569.1 hypothetical protein [Siccirubricoccus soli]
MLGIGAPSPGTPAGDPAELLALWRDAKEEVDAGLNRLAGELRATGDENLVRIADFALYGMTNGEGMGLMKALMQLRAAPPDHQGTAARAVRDAALAYCKAVLGHPLARLVDENPFGIPVGIESRLVAALDRIAEAA